MGLLLRVSDFLGAVVVVFPPLMYWLIIDRIATFMLRLQQSLTAAEPPPDAAGGRPSPAQPTPSSDGEPPEPSTPDPVGLPAPAVSMIDGKRLTGRQLQVILLACEGLTQAEIGRCLDIRPQTVLRHLRKAEAKTGSASTPQLVAWAREAGLVPRPRHQA